MTPPKTSPWNCPKCGTLNHPLGTMCVHCRKPRVYAVDPEPSKRAIGGAWAQRKGRKFQEWVHLSASRVTGLYLTELPACGGRFVGAAQFIREKIPCDFVGGFRGVGVYIDAKSLGQRYASFPIRSNPKVVEPHQVEFLRIMADTGQVAGFLVESARSNEYLWLPAHKIDGGNSEKTVAWEDPRWVKCGAVGKPIEMLPFLRGYWHFNGCQFRRISICTCGWFNRIEITHGTHEEIGEHIARIRSCQKQVTQ